MSACANPACGHSRVDHIIFGHPTAGACVVCSCPVFRYAHSGVQMVQSINIIEPKPRDEHPCLTGHHRWAWLVDGRQACGICGVPR